MATWREAVITKKGLALQSKLTQGTSLTITRAVVGNSYVFIGLNEQTEVKEPKQEASINSVSYPEEGKCAINVCVTNKGLETGYTAQQVGLYATDPDEGEILYLICQADMLEGTIIPSEAEVPSFSADWTFYFQYGQADGVSVTVSPAGALNATQVQLLIDEALSGIPTPDVSGQINNHNNNQSAHSDIRLMVNAKAPMYSYGTEDLVAGDTPLETGKLHFVYE